MLYGLVILGILMNIPKLIPVGNDNWALVDEEDYEELSRRTWHIDSHFYAVTNSLKSDGAARTSLYMHRMVLKPEPGLETDHRNGNTLDNRRSNLRAVTHAENMGNYGRGKQIVKSSRFRGVYYRKDRNRWSAYIGTKKGRDMLGCYATEQEAARSYNMAAKVRYGEFARLNDCG